MTKVSKGLSDSIIKKSKITGKEYTLSDGDGLQLRVRANGQKSWQFRYIHPETHKTCKMSLGAYPHLSLIEARKQTITYNEQVILGFDPKALKEKKKQERLDLHENTLIKVAQKWLEMKKPDITKDHAYDIWRSLELHIFPKLADIPLKKINAPQTIKVLRALEARGSLESVKRVSQRLNEVMDYGVNHGLIQSNPLSGIRKVFKKPKKKNLPALKPDQLPDLMNAIANASIKRTTRCLIEFQLHTITRPSEAVNAEWQEFNFITKVWTIPAEKMKNRIEHKIPLSAQVLALLSLMKTINPNSAFVFPSATLSSKPCHSQTANQALKRMGLAGKTVSHGLRSLASTTLNEKKFDSDLIEAALSHVDTNEIRRIYNRTDYLELRIPMMQWWSDHIEEAANGNLSIAGFTPIKFF